MFGNSIVRSWSVLSIEVERVAACVIASVGDLRCSSCVERRVLRNWKEWTSSRDGALFKERVSRIRDNYSQVVHSTINGYTRDANPLKTSAGGHRIESAQK